ncbi:hypothetical protein [Geitlerinema sp. PCC 9228]|jgi:hypothetical protein|uniref:hypothetical protein n=1 Tax=Geitlerinema sp. PCC 9228 TaxID=111611 RepID=UPI0008F9A298|nr:hypothetical protein [Geitlerinema sp. PCC 9228]
MKGRLPTVVFVTLAAAATSSGVWLGKLLSPPVQAQPPSVGEECLPIADITSVDGKVRHKRVSWDEFHQAEEGKSLCRGDRLQVLEGGSASIVCRADGKTISVSEEDQPWLVNHHCRSPEWSQIDDTAVPNPRSGDRELEILSPQNTLLPTPQPTIRWTPIAGAASYTIQVNQVDGDSWSRENLTTTELAYPSEEEALQYPYSYKLTIFAFDGEGNEIAKDSKILFTIPESKAP